MNFKTYFVGAFLFAGLAYAQWNRPPVDYNAPARFNAKPNAVLINGMVVQAGGGNIVFDGGVRINGNLTVSGTVTGGTALSGAFTGLYVNGNTALDGGVAVGGAQTVVNSLRVGHAVEADGGVRTGTGGLWIGSTGTNIPTSYAGTVEHDFGVLYADATGAHCEISTSVTVTGATVKDQCLVSHDNGMDGGAAFSNDFRLDCHISAANTGKVRGCYYTTDAGTYDAPVANFYLRTFGR